MDNINHTKIYRLIEEIENDPDVRARFLANPAGEFSRHQIDLSPRVLESLADPGDASETLESRVNHSLGVLRGLTNGPQLNLSLVRSKLGKLIDPGSAMAPGHAIPDDLRPNAR